MENQLQTPVSQVKRSNTGEELSQAKLPKGTAVPVAPKAKSTAQQAKAKKPEKPDKTPDNPKVEVKTPDDVTAQAVKSAINRKGTDEMNGAESSQDSGDSGDDDDGDNDQTEEKAERMRIKREAHARFMRFSRSLKSFLTSEFDHCFKL